MEEACRILVVDDEPRGVELLCRALRRLGRVESALSAEEGWEIARDGGIDLVISDQRMPGMSGVEFLARIAEHSEHTGRIVLTGYADIQAAIDAINRGRVHAYLTKPAPPEEIQATVRTVLERMRLARENETLVGELRKALQRLEESQQRVLASERLAAIGRTGSMIIHDLRGPLALIRSSGGEVVRSGREAGSAELEQLGSEIVEEADRMNRSCEDLLEVARASERSARPVDEDLDDVVRAALSPLAEEISRAGIELDLDLACGGLVPLDEDHLRRALLNLVRNAIEAMPDGGALRVETRREDGWAWLGVRDTGVGIPEAMRGRLFEPFATAGKAGGTGLGLAVVKAVVDQHGGAIDVEKAEGGGTAFRLRLPLTNSGT